jgi:hypothetical protein
LLAVLFGTTLIASVGILPHLDSYKSPRAIGEAVRSRLPADVPVYVFQSTMADFNYYARREQIPVVASAEDVRKLSGHGAHLIISDKDLKQNKLNVGFKIVSEHQVGEKKWYLIELS